MSVMLVLNGRGDKQCRLYGQPFPPDDVKAYWSMVPDDIVVEWSQAFGLFCVTRAIDWRQGRRNWRGSWGDNITSVGVDPEPVQPARRLQVMAIDAHKLSTWMSVISELCCGG